MWRTFDDEYRLDALGIFSARYAHLARWGLPALLSELTGHEVDLQKARERFRACSLLARLD